MKRGKTLFSRSLITLLLVAKSLALIVDPITLCLFIINRPRFMFADAPPIRPIIISLPSNPRMLKLFSKYSPPIGSRIISTPSGAQFFIFSKIDLDLISPSDAPSFKQKSTFFLVPAVIKLLQPKAFAS